MKKMLLNMPAALLELCALRVGCACFVGDAADDECCVCAERLHDPTPDRFCLVLCCGHVFHDDCVKEWYRHNTGCPTCRQDMILPARSAARAVAPRIAEPVNQ